MKMNKYIEVSLETHAKIKAAASERGLSMHGYVNQLIEEIGIDDKGKKIILSIPPSVRGKENLREWLRARIDSIVKLMGK